MGQPVNNGGVGGMTFEMPNAVKQPQQTPQNVGIANALRQQPQQQPVQPKPISLNDMLAKDSEFNPINKINEMFGTVVSKGAELVNNIFTGQWKQFGNHSDEQGGGLLSNLIGGKGMLANPQDMVTMPSPTSGTATQGGLASNLSGVGNAVQAVQQPGTSYMDIAKSFLGKTESKDAAALSGFFKKGMGVDVNPQNTAWCAAFANSVLESTGIKGTGSLAARSFLKGGTPVDKPSEGDVLVFSRGRDDGIHGHVGFYAGETENAYKVLGGNQGDGVSIKLIPKSNLLGARHYVAGGKLPQGAMPSEVSNGKLGISDRGISFIKNLEGFNPKAYSDYSQTSVGYGTRGQPGETLTEPQAHDRLLAEVNKLTPIIDKNLTVPITQNQKDALLSFGYNAGPKGLTKVINHLNSGNREDALNTMSSWNKVTKHGKKYVHKGLVNRRKAEIALFTGDDYGI